MCHLFFACGFKRKKSSLYESFHIECGHDQLQVDCSHVSETATILNILNILTLI